MMKPQNPFVITGYRGKEYFCGRQEETRKILSALRNDRNVTLMAPRRYGKTGLIQNVLSSMPANVVKIYLDIYATRNLKDFTQLFARGVLGSLDTSLEKITGAIGRFFSRMRPTITPDSNGNVSFSFSLADGDAEQSLKSVFDYIASKKKRVVIAIDEFQQILSYPETGTEALLRSYIQFAENVHFIFAGSSHHLMGEMFTSPRHPFYQSTDVIPLDVIPLETYRDFAAQWFAKDKRPFNAEGFAELYHRFRGITWYVQCVLNRIWGEGTGLGDAAQIEAVVKDLVEVRKLTYHDLLTAQTENCRQLLVAIAKEGVVKEITAGAFLAKHGMLAASSVRSALQTMMNRDLVYHFQDGYMIYDLFFADYLRALE